MNNIEKLLTIVNDIKNENIKTNELITSYQILFNIVEKMLNDELFVNSDLYEIFKNNYINKFYEYYNIVKNNGIIKPEIIIKVKEPTGTGSRNIDINNIDIYKPKQQLNVKLNIPKNKEKQNKCQNVYLLKIPSSTSTISPSLTSPSLTSKYVFNPNNNNIYNLETFENVGNITDNVLSIKDNDFVFNYKLKTIYNSELNDKKYKFLNNKYITIA